MRMLPGLDNFSYEERLAQLGMFSMEWRRLNKIIKIRQGLDRLMSSTYFPEREVKNWKEKLLGPDGGVDLVLIG